MHLQTAFNIMTRGLLAQGEPAREQLLGALADQVVCKYRTTEGLRCAIGQLISPHISSLAPCGRADRATRIEEIVSPVSLLLNLYPMLEQWLDVDIAPDSLEMGFLKDMQRVHDRQSPANWRAGFNCVAENFGLAPIPANLDFGKDDK